MQDSRRREIRIKADSFRVKCKISRYGIIDLFKECENFKQIESCLLYTSDAADE